jgi:ribose-phosphate pyrophosphokinase
MKSGGSLNDIRIFSGNSNRPLADKIAQKLGLKVCECTIDEFSNTEIRIIPNESVRKKNVYIVQTGSYDSVHSINDYLMETLLLMDAVHRSGATEINLLVPCYPYSRQDKKDKARAPISAALVANLFMTCHVTRIVCVDLHAASIQGLFSGPCDNLYCVKPIIEYLEKDLFIKSPNYQDEFVAISPDAGAVKRVSVYAGKMKLKYMVMSKERNYDEKNIVENTILLGDPILIKNKTVLIFDDMIDTAGTIIKSVDYLVENGAKDAVVVVAHGILSGPAIDRINKCKAIKYVLVSDSLPQEENLKKTTKLRVFTLSDMYAEVITRLENKDSISEMFC